MKKISFRELAKECANIAAEKKARKVVILDVRKLTPFVDYYVISSGRTNVHVEAIAQSLVKELKGKNIYPLHREGIRVAQWILLDYVGVMVHIFKDDMRKYYKIEDLWANAKIVKWEESK